MASQTPITDWCLANQDTLKSQIQSLNWTKDWFEDYYDFEVTLQIGRSTVIGRGTDRDQRLSLEKAFAEAIERHFTRQKRLYYHGVAIHSNERQAVINAESEYYERSIFFSKVQSSQEIFLNEENHGDFEIPHEIEKKIWRHGYNIEASLISDPFEGNGTIYTHIKSPIAKRPQFLGMSEAAFGFEQAFEKSLIEAVRGFAGYLHTGECEWPIPSTKGVVRQDHGTVDTLTEKGIFNDAPLTFAFTKESYFEPDFDIKSRAVSCEK